MNQARRNRVLQVIRDYPDDASKTFIQRKTRMGMESTIVMVNSLLAQEWIYEAGVSGASVGRKSTLLRINPSGQYFIGVRFNVGHVWTVLYDFTLQEVARTSRTVERGVNRDALIAMIKQCIQAMRDMLGDKKDRLCGIGIAAPGINDYYQGISKRYIHIADWVDVPLAKIISDAFGCPVFVENSTRCLINALHLEEAGLRNVLLIQVGRGVGSAILINGKIFRGSTNSAGNIGHIKVSEEPILCECGRTGCMEAMAGFPALRRMIQAGRQMGKFSHLGDDYQDPGHDFQDLFDLVRMGDADAAACVREIGTYVGKGAATIIPAVNPEKLVISGMMATLPEFCQAVKESIERESFPEMIESLRVDFCNYDDHMSAVGAVLLVYQHFFSAQG